MNLIHSKNIILHLSLIPDIGSSTIHRLVKQIGFESLQDLYHFKQQDLMRCGLSEKKATLLHDGLQNTALVETELDAIEQVQAQFITPWCQQYSSLLQHIEVPPAVLYYQGDVTLLQSQKMLACVGARKSHSYVQDCLQKIVVPMIQDDWTIVSGGALGADAYAHNIALEHGGKTIVVVGSGLYHRYPPSNKALFQKVIDTGGLIVSSFPVKMEPEARCFPMRNRIISGLSAGTLVLQAAKKSGALITAQFALEQGREVFAIPGPIYDPLSDGCHELIKQGAKLVTQTEDILTELTGYSQKLSDSVKQQVIHGKMDCDQTNEVQTVSDSHIPEYDEHQRLILQHTIVAISIDDLHAKLDIDHQLLHDKLFSMSLDGKIEQDCMGLWKRA